MHQLKPIRVHVITGGFPPGAAAGHDMDYARLRLLQLVYEHTHVRATVANDFTDIATWPPESQLLITYVAGPYPNDEQNQLIQQWLEGGGRWLALHGTSGGKAVRVGEGRRARQMVKTSHHATLGRFFLHHPPLRKFQVQVTLAWTRRGDPQGCFGAPGRPRPLSSCCATGSPGALEGKTQSYESRVKLGK